MGMKAMKFEAGVCGRIKIEAVRLDAVGNEISRRVAAPWFNNLVTDSGLDLIGTSTDFLAACQVGSGSTAPADTDTQLQAHLAGTTAVVGNTSGAQNAVAPYYGWRQKTYRFATGVAAGNLSEVGIAPGATGGVFSRALIRDGAGNPTTITVLADETLDVTYEFRAYAPEADSSAVLDINGTNYTFTGRAIDIDEPTLTSWNNSLGQKMAVSNVGAHYAGRASEAGILPATESGFIDNLQLNPIAIGSYVAGSHYRDFQFSLELSEGNFATGIGNFSLSTTLGAFQFAPVPKIPKGDTEIFTLDVRVSWTRRVL